MGNPLMTFVRKRSSNKSKKSPVSGLILILMIVFTLLGFNPKSISAQTNIENWLDPINLSNSGGTDNPTLVKGNAGELHVIWQDDYAVLANRNFTDSWGQNSSLDLAFSGQSYQIVADNNGSFFVFWINESNNNLQYSGVTERNFGNAGSWSTPATIASSVVAFDVHVDTNNQVHLIFTRAVDSPELPSGIYYLRSLGGLSSWTDARLMYQSKYYRSMIPPEGEIGQIVSTNTDQMHVSVNTRIIDGVTAVFLGWENPFLKRLFYNSSLDNGQTWGQPQEIISPSQELILITPTQLETIFLEENSLQFWKMKEPGGNCSLNYRTSTNNGLDWSSAQSLDSVFGKCPDSLYWEILNSGEVLFIAQNQNTVFLVAWDGARWSLPQGQTELNQFINPATLDIIEFEKISSTVFNDTLYLVGKDKSTSDDIFFTQKKLTNIKDWFGQLSNWSPIQSHEIDQTQILGLSAVNGLDGDFHFLITTKNSEKINASNLKTLSISPTGAASLAIIQDNLEGSIHQITSITRNDGDRTVILWQGGKLGQIYSKWAFLNQINNPVGWSAERQIQTTTTGQFPALTSTQNSDLLAIFANSFDGQKGLFLIKSIDGGEKWSEPSLITDLSSIENCPLIDQSSIVADQLDNLYILFQCSTYPGGIGHLSLYSMQSTDLGESWGNPTMIVDQSVTWNQLIRDDENRIHRIWKIQDEKVSIWHSFSGDQGKTWSAPVNVALLEEKTGPITSAMDRDGNIHILQSYDSQNGNSSIAYFRWDGEKWVNLQSLDLGSAGSGELGSIVAGIDDNNFMHVGVAFNTRLDNVESGILISSKYLLTIENMPEENLTTENIDPNSTQATPEQAPSGQNITATLTPEPEPINKQPGQSSASFSSIIVGVGISLVFIVVILIFMRKKINSN